VLGTEVAAYRRADAVAALAQETGNRAPTLSLLRPDDRRWTEFLGRSSDATVFHHPAWSDVIAESYDFESFVLAQKDAIGRVVAGLPVATRPRPPGYVVIALPFTDYCPPLLSASADLEQFTAPLTQWQRQEPVERIAVSAALPAWAGVHVIPQGVRHLLPLPASSDDVLHDLRRTALPRAIRKAQREGVSTRISQTHDSLPVFYKLHTQTRRRLGVPVQPRRFFELLWRRVIEPGLGFVVLAYQQDVPVAAALFLAWNGNLIYKYGASDHRYWALRPNNLVMWTAIDWGCRNGYRQLDFGRTELHDQGLRDFKSRWGATEVPLAYSYVADRAPRPLPQLARSTMAALIQIAPASVCRGLGELLYGRMAGAAL